MKTVNQERLWTSLMEMGRVGALPAGGCCRLALTDEDRQGRDLFVRWCRECGCEVDVDQVGNIHARRPGLDSAAPAVATGSHLDTQPHGGRFDGAYGVLAGLEVIRSLNDGGIETRAPIEVVVWTNEEGARLRPPLLGSAAFVGKYGASHVHALRTEDGARVGEELERIGYLGEHRPGERELAAFFEAHIEQGPQLEAMGRTIGVVEGVQGMRWYDLRVDGTDAHAGAVPMRLRRDALAASSRMIARLHERALQLGDEIRLTVGRLEVRPNSASTIPGQVSFNVDLRHPRERMLDEVELEMRSELAALARAHRVDLQTCRVLEAPPVRFDDEMVSRVAAAAERLGYASCEMTSGAGHDAMNLASRVPTAMVFVPCREGISHNEAEYASPSDLAAGANVLLHAMLEMAQG